jgi:hypothetical protein
MLNLTPCCLISVAHAFVGVREEGGNNHGTMVERFLEKVDQKAGEPWCAAFVYYVGFWSHFEPLTERSSWPLPATASCYMLGQFARKKQILVKEPQPGDVFLVYNPVLLRFAHTGIIVYVTRTEQRASGSMWYECITIEGNTNAEGSREGNAVARKPRRFYPDAGDRFIRWTDLEHRVDAGSSRAA